MEMLARFGEMHCSKGFAFTIMFAALFFLLLQSVSLYLASRGSDVLSQTNQIRADRAGQAMDDLSYDLLSYLELSVESDPLNASNRTSVTFSDIIPSTLSSPGTEFGEWAALAEESFAVSSNINVTLNTTDFSLNPRLVVLPYNLTYGYSSLGKPQLLVNGSGSVTNYTIALRLNRDINAVNGTGWNWSADPTSLYVVLDIEDGAGEQLLVNGQAAGYIDPSLDNRFVLFGTPSGNLTLDAGTFDGSGTPALRIVPAGLSARVNTTILLSGVPEVTIYAPITARVGEQESSLIVFEG